MNKYIIINKAGERIEKFFKDFPEAVTWVENHLDMSYEPYKIILACGCAYHTSSGKCTNIPF